MWPETPKSRVADVRHRLQKPRTTINRTLQALHCLGLVTCNEKEETIFGGRKMVLVGYYSLL
jgi:predicted transcriptional regulator